MKSPQTDKEPATAEQAFVVNLPLAPLALQALNALGAAVSIIDALDPDHPMVYVNPAFCRLTGYDAQELLGRNHRILHSGEADRGVITALRLAVSQKRPISAVLRNRRRDGSTFWKSLSLEPLALPGGGVTHFAALHHETSDWELSAQAAAALDPDAAEQAEAQFLAGVSEALIEQASGRQRHVLVVFSAMAGDTSLAASLDASQMAKMAVRLAGIKVRTSLCFLDAQHVGVLAHLSASETPLQMAQQLTDLLRPCWPCHAGLAEPLVDGKEARALLEVARQASEIAARAGSLEPTYIDPARRARDLRASQLSLDVSGALAAGQLRLVFQPIVELANGHIAGVEALLRWRHPTMGEILPYEFIDQLERQPAIREVTRWIIHTGLMNLARWDTMCGKALRLAVNVPADVLADDGFVAFVLSELSSFELSARQFEIELTERSLTRADGPTVALLSELRRHGVSVAIDDFGTGWSSLAYLTQLPVDTLKIDLQFTRGVTKNRADAAICRTTVELARGLGLRCVAEGIELPGQLQFFNELRCREGQGYLFSRPLEVAALDELLTTTTALGQTEAPSATVATSRGERHLLILDDEENVLRALRRTLRPAGFNIHITTSPDEAFEILARNPIGVILADQRMPQMTGSEFLSRVKDLNPHTRRIVLSGYTDLQSITDAINRGAIYKFITKPWNDAELLALLETAFSEFEMRSENQHLQAALQRANRQLAEALQAKSERLSHGEMALDVMHAAVASVAVPVLGLAPNGDLVMINEAAERLFAADPPMLGEPVDHLLGFDPLAESSTHPRYFVFNSRRHTAHCVPLTAGSRMLGRVLTLLDSPSDLQ